MIGQEGHGTAVTTPVAVKMGELSREAVSGNVIHHDRVAVTTAELKTARQRRRNITADRVSDWCATSFVEGLPST
ncbi:Uncharacterised protein [Mycobacteroides abscessus subsp. abscessus]|nr:Uncharacterised protein [Mycobacteroides abscessus subsp. abscessus]SLH39867.1 Uncharacterised protein [Mycobacteroides abscessus subsp. abscessus]